MNSRAYAGLPPSARGQRIGLFGGSFNPPHEGHRAASLMALRRLKLDRIWWVVTQGNPLKDTSNLPGVADRMEAARQLAAHPSIDITGFEKTLGSPYTYELIDALTTRLPDVRFVLVLGADSLASLHNWRHWRRIIDTVPLAVIDRPGFTLQATRMPAAATLSGHRLAEQDAPLLVATSPPAYVFLHGRRSEASSTVLRDRKQR